MQNYFFQNSHNSMFSFDGREMVNISISPGEVFKQRIDCFGVAVEALTSKSSKCIIHYGKN